MESPTKTQRFSKSGDEVNIEHRYSKSDAKSDAEMKSNSCQGIKKNAP
jgi:hypothetical protein